MRASVLDIASSAEQRTRIASTTDINADCCVIVYRALPGAVSWPVGQMCPLVVRPSCGREVFKEMAVTGRPFHSPGIESLLLQTCLVLHYVSKQSLQLVKF